MLSVFEVSWQFQGEEGNLGPSKVSLGITRKMEGFHFARYIIASHDCGTQRKMEAAQKTCWIPNCARAENTLMLDNRRAAYESCQLALSKNAMSLCCRQANTRLAKMAPLLLYVLLTVLVPRFCRGASYAVEPAHF